MIDVDQAARHEAGTGEPLVRRAACNLLARATGGACRSSDGSHRRHGGRRYPDGRRRKRRRLENVIDGAVQAAYAQSMDGRRLIQQYVQEIDASRPGDAVSSQLGAEFDEADCVVRVRWVEDDDPREGILVIRDGEWLLVSVSPPVEEAARSLELHLQPLGKIDDAAIVEDWGYRDEGGLVWNRLAALSLTHEKVPGGGTRRRPSLAER